MDVLHGRQVARRGQAPAGPCQALGAQGAHPRSHSLEERVQALQHVCDVVCHYKPRNMLTLHRVKNKYTPWQPKCEPR